jgi:DNA-directed RNA polymerase subunit M/transcription elongation factor TFIIS
MRMCLECGGVAYTHYAYQIIECQSCGHIWSIEQYEREVRRSNTDRRRRIRVGRKEHVPVVS